MPAAKGAGVSDERDKELILDWMTYLEQTPYRFTARGALIDTFLAARSPQDELPIPINLGRNEGEDAPPDPPPAPQRFWRVRGFGGGPSMDPFCYQAWEVDERGAWMCTLPMAVTWARQEEAEADGRASGLPEWKP